MKKLNIIYLALIPVVFGIYYINKNYSRQAVMFYGFAENKETEINHEHPVEVDKIYVTTGDFVNKGDLLMEVTHSKFDLKMNDLSHEIETMRLQVAERRADINREIIQLENERISKLAEVGLNIQKIQAEIDLNNSLLKDLKSIKIKEGNSVPSPSEIKLSNLEKEKELINSSFDQRIKLLKGELAMVSAPREVQMEKLENEKNYYQAEQKKLSIRAPKDGLIGNIHCLEGENKSSFSTLITFYERNPTLVKGYVHENLIVHVEIGDVLEVSSILNPDHKRRGKITGLGSRIVEIPERLRKIPELKTYGREVLIQIPPDNPFLQKEKVVLNFLNPVSIRQSPVTTNSNNTPLEELQSTEAVLQ